MHNTLAVIIPNWNGLDFIEDCLRSLERQTLRHHVIVVDNGSTDGSLELIQQKFPKVEVLAFPNNAGFAGGVNRGIKPALKAKFEYIVLLNNDAAATPNWLEELVSTAKAHPEAGIVTSKIRHFGDNKLDSTGDFYSTWGFAFPRGRDEHDTGQYDDEVQQVVFGASGGASLYRADMLRRVGLFDERFFAYFEDVDISFRAQLAGWQVRYAPKAVVNHHIGGTSGKISQFARYHSVKNFVYLYTKNMPGRLYWKYLPLAATSFGMMLVSDLKRGQLVTFIKASLVALAHLPAILLSRWHIQRGRQVSLTYIDDILYHGLPPLQKLRFRRFNRN
jgi:GT2 family glycosyltransferase